AEGGVVPDVENALRDPGNAGIRVGAREDQGAGAFLLEIARAAEDSGKLQRAAVLHEDPRGRPGRRGGGRRGRRRRGRGIDHGVPHRQVVDGPVYRETAVTQDDAVAVQHVVAAVERDGLEQRVGGKVVGGGTACGRYGEDQVVA